MNKTITLSTSLACLLILASCGDSAVEFDAPPSAALIASGEVEVIQEDLVRYHVLNFGNRVTAAIVESETDTIVIDVAFGLIPNSGTELRAYVDAIGKPVSVIITHGHQDHYGNMDQFADATVYAETANAAFLMADDNFTGLYDGTVNGVSGSVMIGGLEFVFDNVTGTEASENGYIYLPEHGALFTGDLTFNRAHAYIREYTPLDDNDELDTWLAALESMKVRFGSYNHIIMGHTGRRADVIATLDENIAYISDAQGLINGSRDLTSGGAATSVQDVVDELGILYPDYEPGGLVLALPDGFFPGDPGAVWFE
ncbi:MAG: MBL fold metallo-hydrolase [Sandaracinaceae bacterium]